LILFFFCFPQEDMVIAKEEIFGPVMCMMKFKYVIIRA